MISLHPSPIARSTSQRSTFVSFGKVWRKTLGRLDISRQSLDGRTAVTSAGGILWLVEAVPPHYRRAAGGARSPPSRWTASRRP
jgi:hypothetical protein